MSRENRDLIVNGISILLIGLVFVLVFAIFVPKTKADNVFGKPVKLESSDISGDYNKELIKAKYIASNGKKEVGTIYEVHAENSFGSMDFYLGIDLDDLISIQMINIEQSQWAIMPTNSFINENIKNLTEDELNKLVIPNLTKDSLDAETNVTTSPSDVKFAALEVLAFHFNRIEELTDLELIFGEGSESLPDTEFETTENILSRNLISLDNTFIGQSYLIKGSGPYYETESGSIKIEFILDSEGIIKGSIIDETSYGHTKSYIRQIKPWLDELTNTNINDLVVNDIDGVTGVTNTSRVVLDMLQTLKEAYMPLLDPIEQIYGKGAIAEVDLDFAATSDVILKQNIYLQNDLKGLIYTLEGSAIYHGETAGQIEFNILLDTSNIILDYEINLDNYEHTSSGSFFTNVNNYLTNLKGINVNNFELPEEVDSKTGATNTTNLINELLIALKGVISND